MSETPIDANLVRRLVATQFPAWADLPVQAVRPGGWDNRTFRLGAEMSVRLPSAERYAGKVAKEQRCLRRLGPLLPLPIPTPLALGAPGEGYPWPWSVYRWIEGETAAVARITDPVAFAQSLAGFLEELQCTDPTDGPPPGAHNFFRGGPVATYDVETRRTLTALRDRIDTAAAAGLWRSALESTWRHGPVWIHGDVSPSNLLVCEGRLSAVIDFGGTGVGDPACDLTIAWTFLQGESRAAFRAALPLDADTWARARGWALWKALITLAEHIDSDEPKAADAERVIETVLTEHAGAD